MMTDSPYNFVTDITFDHAHTAGPLVEHRTKYGFTSWGYATKLQAGRIHYKLRRGEAPRYAYVRFESMKPQRYYNQDQFDQNWAAAAE